MEHFFMIKFKINKKIQFEFHFKYLRILFIVYPSEFWSCQNNITFAYKKRKKFPSNQRNTQND